MQGQRRAESRAAARLPRVWSRSRGKTPRSRAGIPRALASSTSPRLEEGGKVHFDRTRCRHRHQRSLSFFLIWWDLVWCEIVKLKLRKGVMWSLLSCSELRNEKALFICETKQLIQNDGGEWIIKHRGSRFKANPIWKDDGRYYTLFIVLKLYSIILHYIGTFYNRKYLNQVLLF